MENKLTAHHGTIWEKPLIPSMQCIDESVMFENILADKNSLKAFFMSQNKSVCEFFSDIKLIDDENQIQAILTIEAQASHTVELSFFTDSFVKYQNITYDYSDNDSRQELYTALKNDGVQLLAVKDDYSIENEGPGDDIAVFDTSILTCTGIDLKINGSWKRNLMPDKAKSLFLRWCEISNEEIAEYKQYCA